MVTAGAIVAGLGAITLGVGIAMLVDAESRDISESRSTGLSIGSYFVTGFGAVLTLGGLAALFTGSSRMSRERKAGLALGRTRRGTWTGGVTVRF